MSLFPELPARPAEPAAIAEARRRDGACSDYTSLTAKDRRALLQAYDALLAEIDRLSAPGPSLAGPPAATLKLPQHLVLLTLEQREALQKVAEEVAAIPNGPERRLAEASRLAKLLPAALVLATLTYVEALEKRLAELTAPAVGPGLLSAERLVEIRQIAVYADYSSAASVSRATLATSMREMLSHIGAQARALKTAHLDILLADAALTARREQLENCEAALEKAYAVTDELRPALAAATSRAEEAEKNHAIVCDLLTDARKYHEEVEAERDELAVDLQQQAQQAVVAACECGEDAACALLVRAEEAEARADTQKWVADEGLKHEAELKEALQAAERQTTYLRRELHRIADFAEGHGADQPGHIVLHGLTVDVPSMCRTAAGMPAPASALVEETPAASAWKPSLPVEELAGCWCRTCEKRVTDDLPVLEKFSLLGKRMITCPKCGNKRCPKAEWHRYACTGSNEPGQVGIKETGAAPLREKEGRMLEFADPNLELPPVGELVEVKLDSSTQAQLRSSLPLHFAFLCADIRRQSGYSWRTELHQALPLGAVCAWRKARPA